jgi:hypothetical protein
MDIVTVGPFTVLQIPVGEGLELMELSGSEDKRFTRKLIELCVRKDGQPVLDIVPFSELMPHLTEVVNVALRINGFKKPDQADSEPKHVKRVG